MARIAFNWLRHHALTTVLLVASLFMSMLILEQGRIIDNQQALIRQLFSDSLELNARKMRDLQHLEQKH